MKKLIPYILPLLLFSCQKQEQESAHLTFTIDNVNYDYGRNTKRVYYSDLLFYSKTYTGFSNISTDSITIIEKDDLGVKGYSVQLTIDGKKYQNAAQDSTGTYQVQQATVSSSSKSGYTTGSFESNVYPVKSDTIAGPYVSIKNGTFYIKE